MPSSNLPKDLLQHAADLISESTGRPQQVALRRSISASYYAAWHTICQAVASKFAPELHLQITRTPEHGRLKTTAHKLRKNKNPWLKQNCNPHIAEMCDDIIYLMQRRHQADYDMSITLFKSDALESHRRAARVQETIVWAQRNAKAQLDALFLEILCVQCPKRD